MYYTGNKSKKINRWNYVTRSDKVKFVSTMHIISLAALLEFLLVFKILPELIYSFLFFDSGILKSVLFYSFTQDEVSYIVFNIATILITFISTFITGAFVILCLQKFAAKPDSRVWDKVTYKFKLPGDTPALLVTGLCVIHFSILLSGVLNIIFNHLFDVTPRVSDYMTYFPETAFGLILYFISIVLVPAFAEEFIFRFVMLNALKKYGNIFAIIVTSLFFGFAHARTSAFLYATAIGVFSAYIAVKTGSIWFSVIIHAIHNAVTFIFQYVAVLPFMDDTKYDIIYFVFLSVISAVSLIYSVIFAGKRKKFKLNAPADYIHIGNRMKLIFFFNAASIIFFILAVLESAEEYGF